MTNRFGLAALPLVAALWATPGLAADLTVDAPVAANEFYATIFAGGAFTNLDLQQTGPGPDDDGVTELTFETAPMIGAALGVSVTEDLRAEVELSYTTALIAEWDGFSLPGETSGYEVSLFGNLWYDFDTGSAITPYLGAGLGISYRETSHPAGGLEVAGLAYQVGAGVRVDVADNVALDLGYRLRVRPDTDITVDGDAPPPGYEAWASSLTHVVQVGVSFGF